MIERCDKITGSQQICEHTSILTAATQHKGRYFFSQTDAISEIKTLTIPSTTTHRPRHHGPSSGLDDGAGVLTVTGNLLRKLLFGLIVLAHHFVDDLLHGFHRAALEQRSHLADFQLAIVEVALEDAQA